MRRAVRFVTFAVALGVAAPAAAQNREHQQMFADLRMLQEQVQQLRLTVNTLAEAVKTIATKQDEQANAVRKVKKFESGMVVNPLTIHPEQSLADALGLMSAHQISGIPVVERNNGKLVGILTNRDVRFASNPGQKVSELMTKDRLITVREGVSQDEARHLLHQFRIEKLLVVDDHFRCIGLITVKDIEKQVAYPNAAKDVQGRLLVAAATTTGEQGFERAERLIDAGCDVVVVHLVKSSVVPLKSSRKTSSHFDGSS